MTGMRPMRRSGERQCRHTYVGEVEEGLQDGEDDGRVVELQSVLEHVQDIVQIVLGGRMPQRLWSQDGND
jgi:hypothetical protein